MKIADHSALFHRSHAENENSECDLHYFLSTDFNQLLIFEHISSIYPNGPYESK